MMYAMHTVFTCTICLCCMSCYCQLAHVTQPVKYIHSEAELAYMFTSDSLAQCNICTVVRISEHKAVYSVSVKGKMVTVLMNYFDHRDKHCIFCKYVEFALFSFATKYPSDLLWYMDQPSKFKPFSSAHVFSHSVRGEQMFEGENYILPFFVFHAAE